MNVIKRPNLPQNKVSYMLCGYNAEIFSALLNNSIVPVDCGKSLFLNKYVDSHADMVCTHLGSKIFLTDKYNSQLSNALRDLGFSTLAAKSKLTMEYPGDCALNCAIIGDRLICNTKYVDKSLLNYFENANYEIIHTNQGYTKCNICIVNENSIITSDTSIYNVLKNILNVLLIESGSIKLTGYDSGFIGGCSGLIDKHTLAFTGDIKLHPSFKEIESFLTDRMVDYLTLIPEKQLVDVGSLIPILEYD